MSSMMETFPIPSASFSSPPACSAASGDATLNESNPFFRALTDHTTDAIFIRDCNGSTVFANQAALRMFGRSLESVIGCGCRELYASPDDAETIEAHDREVITGGAAVAVEETVLFSDGIRIFNSIRVPWLGERGRILGVICISTDITERKRIEGALASYEAKLESTVAERTAELRELIGHSEEAWEEERRVIGRQLHDNLGSELTALNMHFAILLRRLPDDPQIVERAARIKALLESVTQAARRIQAGLHPDKLDVFGIKIAIAELANEFERDTGVTCRVDLPDEELCYPSQIAIPLLRMVQEALNSVARHAAATHVDVVLDDTDDGIVLVVRGNSIGPDTCRPAHCVTHGLLRARERAACLGGDLKIIGTPDRGTDVVVTLPKQIGSAHTPAGGRPRAPSRQDGD